MLPSHSRILAEAISIAATSLKQRQSISLASFFQCPYLPQSIFPILIHLLFFIVNQDQGSALKVAYIFKVFGAKSCLMTA